MTLRVSPIELVRRAEATGKLGLVTKHPSWSRVRLGEVASVVNGAAFKSANFNIDGNGMPLIRIRDVGSDRVSTWYDGKWDDRYLVTPGDLLVGMDGDFRAARWTVGQGLLNQRVCRIDVDPKMYEPKFLEYALPGYLDLIWAATSATTVKHLSSKSVQDIPLPNPPLEDQRRIVEILEDHLSRLDAAADYAAASSKRLSALRDQLVRDAITGRNVAGDRQEPILSDASTNDGTLPALPSGWMWRRLEEVADVVGGITKDSKKQSDPAFIEVPYLRVANVQRGSLRLDDVTRIRVAPAKAEALRLRPGDVLLNEGGDRDKLARGWVWQGEIENCIHQNHVFRARTRDGLDPYFLSWTANTIGARWAERNGKQSVNLASISLSMIRKMPVIVPPPDAAPHIIQRLHEQLSSVVRTSKQIDAAQVRGSGLRRAVLTAAFAGRLTGRHTDQEVLEELADAPSSNSTLMVNA